MSWFLLYLAVGGINVAHGGWTGKYGMCRWNEAFVEITFDLLFWWAQLLFYAVFAWIPNGIESLYRWMTGERR